MTYRHTMAELAPRDVVARAIFEYEQQGQQVFLDATAVGKGFTERFPSITKACLKRGFDPVHGALPITPAAHFLMGGVKSDLNGASNLPGLFICGEAACTGVHGANRLASNSLLEGLVFSHRAAKALAAVPELPDGLCQIKRLGASRLQAMLPKGRGLDICLPRPHDPEQSKAMISQLRRMMWDQVGLVRHADGLMEALDLISQLEREAHPGALELGDMLTIARLVTQAALARRESRGSHFREDYPPPLAATSGQFLSQGALS
jgi:L-aspartate oxidase